jgi:hypothetical protein
LAPSSHLNKMTSSNSSGKQAVLEDASARTASLFPCGGRTQIWAWATASPAVSSTSSPCVIPICGRGRPLHGRHRDHQEILFYTHVSVGVFTRAHPFFLSRLLDSANGWSTCGCLAIFSRLKGRKMYLYYSLMTTGFEMNRDLVRNTIVFELGRCLWRLFYLAGFVYSVKVKALS